MVKNWPDGHSLRTSDEAAQLRHARFMRCHHEEKQGLRLSLAVKAQTEWPVTSLQHAVDSRRKTGLDLLASAGEEPIDGEMKLARHDVEIAVGDAGAGQWTVRRVESDPKMSKMRGGPIGPRRLPTAGRWLATRRKKSAAHVRTIADVVSSHARKHVREASLPSAPVSTGVSSPPNNRWGRVARRACGKACWRPSPILAPAARSRRRRADPARR
jgi:hypothetical protein